MAEQDFQRMLDTIKKLNAEIEKLSAKLVETGSAIDSVEKQGGTSVLRRVYEEQRQQLNALNAELGHQNRLLQETADVYTRLTTSYNNYLASQKGNTQPVQTPSVQGPRPYFTNTPASESKIFPPVDPRFAGLRQHIDTPATSELKQKNEQLTAEINKRTKAESEIYFALQREKNAIEEEIAAIKKGTVGRSKEVYKPDDPDVLARQRITEATTARDKAEKELLQARFNATPEGKLRELYGGTELISKQEALRLEQETLLKSVRSRIASENRYKTALDIATREGFTVDDLQTVRSRGTAGVEELKFRKTDAYGVNRQLDLFNTQGGRTTAGISNQFRTFGQGVVRDIGELTKWSIALAAVYGPMQKLGELTQEMIQNQTKLAEATIVVSSSFLDQSKIFDIAAESADKSGEAISGVIDAFTLAYRATGGVGDEITRLSTAQKLLNDSLILSKLSSLDQATAIDTLGAAVRQTGGDFDKTSSLLDSWVRVTKVANVDLATLATGFATVGDAAENVGLKTDELNGILAVLAESTNQSGQEVANTSRAIISGFQSDQGIQALESLGIATQDVVGNMRSLRDVMTEVASLREKGIINDTQFASLTLAIGGGTRRQAAVATFIENYSRAMQVAQESSRANGDAQEALAKQLDTVQTSLTKLGNSFTTLAQTLGTEGGFLSIIQGSVENMTALVSTFDKLISILGKATPAMAAFIAASVVLKARGQGGIQQALFGAGQNLIGGLPGDVDVRLAQVSGASQRDISKIQNQQALGGVLSTLTGKGVAGGAIQGLLLSAIPAIMNATNDNDRWGGTKATANIVGGVGGAIVGSLVAGSPLIGAAVGTAISEAFVNSTIARRTDIFAYNTEATFGPSREKFDTPQDMEAALDKATQDLYKSIGGGSEAFGKFLTTGAEKNAKRFIEEINNAIKNQDKAALDEILGRTLANSNVPTSRNLNALGLTEDQIRAAFSEGQQLLATPESVTYRQASPEAQKAYDAVLAAIKAVDDAKGGVNTPFTQETAANKVLYGDIIKEISNQSKKTLATQRLEGDVTGAEYARRSTALTGFDTKSLQYYTAFGKEFETMNDDIVDATDAFEAFNAVIVEGAADSVPELTAMVGMIEDLTNVINNPDLQKDPEVFKKLLESLGVEDIADAEAKLKEYKDTAASIITDVYRNQQMTSLNIPQIEGQINKPLTTPENTLVEQRTKQLQDSFYQGFLKIPDEMYEALRKSWEDFAVAIKDSGDTFYKSVTETDQQFRQAAIQQLQEEGKLASQKDNPFDIQQLDITSAQGAGLQGSIDYFSAYLAQNFPQYKQNPEDVGVIFSDYVTDVLHGDNLAIKLALEKIVDLNQKQLDGMYNIPEGATFWVPLTAAYYRPQNEGGAGGLPAVDAAAVDGNTTATDANTRALAELTAKYSQMNADRLKLEYPDAKAPDKYDPYGIAKRAEPQNRGMEITQYAPGSLAAPYRAPETYDGFEKVETGSFIQALIDGIRNFFSSAGGSPYTFKEPGKDGPLSPTIPSFNNRTEATQSPQVQARLDLRFDNSVQLIVDGRVLASVVTPYLASDLVKLEASQGTITKRYVI